MMKRFAVLLALGAMLLPFGAQAHSTTVTPPWSAGPTGGDQYNQVRSDPATGDMTVLRAQPAGISGGLGCGGSGGYASFSYDYTSVLDVKSITATYREGLVDPYTWLNLTVLKDGRPIVTEVLRGPLVGNGSITLNVPERHQPLSGAMTIWFGIQVSSACPNVDGGHAVFDALTFAG